MKKEFKVLIIRIMLCLLLLIIALLAPEIQYLKLTLFLLSYLIIGFDIIKEALEKIFHGEIFEEDFLMFVATTGAFVIGEYPEAITVMLLFQIGECLEDHMVEKSKDSIVSLMDIRPEFANIEKEGKLIQVSPNEIAIGDIIIVNPGEKIPLDGIVIEGETLLDTSSLTGESKPQKVTLHSTVYSGSINTSTMVKVKVIKTYENSTVSKIMQLVEEANDRKTKTEKFITKFSKIYTPIVVLLALGIAVLPPLLLEGCTWTDYLHRACSFLVISCPCALVISIPLSFFAGLGNASKNGILIKGSNYFELLSQLHTIVFDKTGTLTKGVFEVTKIEPVNGSAEELLTLAAYAENYSTHPIAFSIKKAYGKPIPSDLVMDSQEIPGKGLSVMVNGKKVDIGNHQLMESYSIDIKEPAEIGTIVYVAENGKYLGYLVIADKIKKNMSDIIAQFHAKKIHTIMLTGDNQTTANQVAQILHIEEKYSELLPSDKVEHMETILKNPQKYGKTAFVGDGMNDAPVLMHADVGIAMGGLGSDAAIEAADVVIMDDNLAKISVAMQIAQHSLHIVKENIALALSVKLTVLLLSAFGITNMWMAVFADVGVTLLAIFNAMRIFKYKFNK